jgi:hypothetical protein
VATTQDPIEQVLGKLGEFGLPVGEIGDKAKGLISQVGSMDTDAMMEQVTSIDFKQLDITEMFSELKDKVEGLDPALRVPVMVAAGFVGARILRWVIR